MDDKLKKKIRQLRYLLILILVLSALVLGVHLLQSHPWYRFIPVIIGSLASGICLIMLPTIEKKIEEAEK
ncbi:hypothetical protein BN1356_00250 [Streptococcus varani]|jgi:uncharacterized membrane protein|uniref:Uncharacterized protein n=1 Tax=Streptococcus varani TaxID=1608583 RepID=A0A0E3WEL3_9STRE|nr:hypothetical protein [Streptococcus varani]CQR23881.1 hypothetical protein BN1356_00250 [Streptococcus varani]